MPPSRKRRSSWADAFTWNIIPQQQQQQEDPTGEAPIVSVSERESRDALEPLTLLSPDDDYDEAEQLRNETMLLCVTACLHHLQDFLAKSPDSYYQDWIHALHPENSKAGSIDRRFYLRDSHHRRMWNQAVDETRYVKEVDTAVVEAIQGYIRGCIQRRRLSKAAGLIQGLARGHVSRQAHTERVHLSQTFASTMIQAGIQGSMSRQRLEAAQRVRDLERFMFSPKKEEFRAPPLSEQLEKVNRDTSCESFGFASFAAIFEGCGTEQRVRSA